MTFLTALSRPLSVHAIAWAAAILGNTSGLAWAQSPGPIGHTEEYARADIELGARLYGEDCDRCHGPDGQGLSGLDMRSGKFGRASTDQQLRAVITNGAPSLGMPAFRMSPAELTGMVAYLRNMNSIDRGSLKPGDSARGKTIVETKGGCLSCHRINGVGGRSAPDLSTIGTNRSAAAFERTLLDPDNVMWPINRPVHIVTKDGKTISGRRLNEDTFTVQLVDQEGRLVSLVKSDLREFTVSAKSTMPSYKDRLSSAELSDVITYLLSLKGL